MFKEYHSNLPSNRSFGITFGLISLVVALWNFLFNNGEVQITALVISFFFFFFALIFPKLLLPLNKFWFKFGMLLNFIMTPLIMGIIFFFVLTPIALLLRLFNKRPMNLRKSNAKSYWILRKDENLSENMKLQF